jgi:acyl-CoA synthetase (NDP forming)
MVIDRLAASGIAVDPPSAATCARLAAAGLAVKPARLVDLTTAGTRYEAMKAALDILMAAPEFDLVLAVVGSSARFHPELAVRPVVDCASAGKPLAAFLTPEAPEALLALSRGGVPSFRTPESCADAIAAALLRRMPRELPARLRDRTESTKMLDELEAYSLLDRLGIARAPALALDAGLACAPDLPFPYPVAVKALSAGVAHKTELGGVVLGVGNGESLIAAVAQMRRKVSERSPATRIDRVLVQPMVEGVGEALIGYRIDRDVGPLVLLAAGGIATEIFRDRSLRLAPVDVATAHEMIAEVRSLKLIGGYRGLPAGDIDALARAIVALSQAAVMAEPAIAEAEINPLVVRRRGDGVVAVDALVRLHQGKRI